jgi:hypothetical protein
MEIPCDLLVFNIAMYLEPADKLSLAMTSKQVYETFFNANPGFKRLYSRKYCCGVALKNMLEFVRKGPTGVASWTLLCDKAELYIGRTPSSCYSITGLASHMASLDLFTWFSHNMWPKRASVMISTRCNYKKNAKRAEFMALTNVVINVLR